MHVGKIVVEEEAKGEDLMMGTGEVHDFAILLLWPLMPPWPIAIETNQPLMGLLRHY